MNKEYKKIEFTAGSRLDKCVKELLKHRERNELVYGYFNGHKLYSDTVNLDDAYKKIIGQTWLEYNKEQEKWIDEYEKQRKKHIEKIPELSKVWKQKGREVLEPDRWELWDKNSSS